jgi:membrane protease YdiL (CAAX protease family)
MNNSFPIKGRYVMAIWLIPFIYFPGLKYIYELVNQGSEWYWYEIIYYYCYHFVFATFLVGFFYWHKINIRKMFRPPNTVDYIPSLKFSIFIIIFSIATAYALFYPLSYILPEFVNYWFIDLPPIIYSNNNKEFPLLPNVLSFVSLVILAPILEELAFRGVLLHRWSQKWGMTSAILISSLLFGVAHPDVIGAFAFGVAMSIIYLKTQTLIVPILCHAFTNIIAILSEAGYIAWLGINHRYTIEDFRSEWPIALITTVIVIIWGYIYLYHLKKSNKVWRLPKL